jgi:hypothetical protein
VTFRPLLSTPGVQNIYTINGDSSIGFVSAGDLVTLSGAGAAQFVLNTLGTLHVGYNPALPLDGTLIVDPGGSILCASVCPQVIISGSHKEYTSSGRRDFVPPKKSAIDLCVHLHRPAAVFCWYDRSAEPNVIGLIRRFSIRARHSSQNGILGGWFRKHSRPNRIRLGIFGAYFAIFPRSVNQNACDDGDVSYISKPSVFRDS